MNVSVRETFAFVEWEIPKFLPSWYQLKGWCSYDACRNARYTLPVQKLSSEKSSATVPVRPGSHCQITLIAVYNTASIDQGITRHVATPYKSKFDHDHHLVYICILACYTIACTSVYIYTRAEVQA